MVKPQLGHDQVVSEWRWSLNTGGHKSRFHCTRFLAAKYLLCTVATLPRASGHYSLCRHNVTCMWLEWHARVHVI